MKKRWLWAAAAAAAYIGLLALLLAVESAAPEASITTFGRAVWYSLVTLTTVGYGDYFPVTAAGQVIGLVFLLASTGLLALLIGAAVSAMTGTLLPRLRLRLVKGRRWYIFTRLCGESAALAAHLAQEEPEAVLVFCQTPGEDAQLLADVKWYRWNGTPAEAAALRNSLDDCEFLVLGPDSGENYAEAAGLLPLGAPVYCQTDFVPEPMPANLTLFDRWDCCARLYWQQHPLHSSETDILLIGGGRCGGALLERALLVNVCGPDRAVTYHVFGDDGSFLRSHPQLETALAGRDTVVFHDEPWDADFSLLTESGRILLCGDDEGETLDILQRLRRYFPVGGQVHLRHSRQLDGTVTFGADGDLFTPELVLRTRLNHIAREMHEIYRRSTGGTAPAWEELSDFLRRSNIAAADHLLTKIRILLADDAITDYTAENCRRAWLVWQDTRAEQGDFYREIEHVRWVRFHALHNWRYAPQRDNTRRLHPDLRAFCELSAAEQAKDDYAWELLAPLADYLEKEARHG